MRDVINKQLQGYINDPKYTPAELLIRYRIRNTEIRKYRKWAAKKVRPLSDETVLGIKAKLKEGIRNCDIAREFKVPQNAISDIKTGRTYVYV